MGLRVRQRERFGVRGDQADEAFVRAHRRHVDGFALEAFRGEELETTVGAQHVDRADLGDHVGGDVHHDAIEARLCVHRLRHDFAEPAQQQAGSAERATRGHFRSVF